MFFSFSVNKNRWISEIVFLWVLTLTHGLPRNVRTNEICGHYNGYRLYLEQGSSGILEAHNVSLTNNTELNFISHKQYYAECTLELVTCPSCVIKVTLSYTDFPSKCSHQNNITGCSCDHLVLSEPPYDSGPNIKHYCGSNVVYKSKTRSVQIKFIHWNNISHAFTLEYVSEQNRDIITSNPGNFDSKTGPHNRVISSPFFPQFYPRDLTIEHILTCNVEACRIHVMFEDFQLSLDSTMEFFDSNGERIDVTSGAVFRPPVIISSGPRLVVRFSANGGTNIGYKAKVMFITPIASTLPVMRPITNCGGFVENIGGAITMMKMLSENATDNTKIFDCIWIVKPPNSYLHLKTHLSLRIDSFENMGEDSRLIVRQGTTSDRPILEEITPDTVEKSPRSFVVPLISGFYVHLVSGTFNYESSIAIVYTAFSYMNCYVGSEFLCKNHRCIPILLQCDGFDQCGDNSDEPETCLEEWQSEPIDRRWYQHTPNYYFPKMDRYPDLKTTTLIFVMSSMCLVFMISCLILMIHRNSARASRERELQSQLQTISELLDSNNNLPRIEEPEEAPPYEAPPNYDEVIKVGMDDQMKAKKERRSGRKSRMNRRRSSANSAVRLTVNLPEEGIDMPSTSSLAHSDADEPFLSHPGNLDFLPSAHILDIAETDEKISSSCRSSRHYSQSQISPEMYQNISLFETLNNEESLSYQPELSDTKPKSLLIEFPVDASFEIQPQLSNNRKSPSRMHLWNENSKHHQSWIVFSSEEKIRPISRESYDNLNFEHMKELDDYFSAYHGKSGLSQSLDSYTSNMPHSELSTSNDLKSCFCSSSQSIISAKFKSSLMNNKMECKNCNELILGEDTNKLFCNKCIEIFYSPKICIACSGRISFQDLKSMHSPPLTRHLTLYRGHTNQKLCNCFPKYPSQNFSSIQPTEPTEIQILPKIVGKCSSLDEMIIGQRPQKLPGKAHSHSGLPDNMISVFSLDGEDSFDNDSE